jgi:hypothetical protein
VRITCQRPAHRAASWPQLVGQDRAKIAKGRKRDPTGSSKTTASDTFIMVNRRLTMMKNS